MNEDRLSRIRKNNSIIKSVLLLLNLAAVAIAYICGVELKYLFCTLIVADYLICLPRKLFNPKNMVFAYYFIWYCLCTIFANRYKMMYADFGFNRVNTAYLMCFITYTFIMITLEIMLYNTEKKVTREKYRTKAQGESEAQGNIYRQKLSPLLKMFLWGCLITGLYFYVYRTGGLNFWITNPNDAFFSRRGSGMYYLFFTNSLILLMYFEGQTELKSLKSYLRRILYFVVFAACYIFIGSRSTTFMILLILLSNMVLNLKLRSKNGFFLVLIGTVIFVVGMYVRSGPDVMGDLTSSVSSILNYFDTFENLLITLRDFEPSFGRTVLLPLNWLPMKLGVYFGQPFYDMSIWLTTVYYPDSWMNGGTTQWPIEADMYFSFYFIFGIPFVMLYFAIIACIYKKAQVRSVWRLIYVIEAFYIVSHLRGGLLIFWYYWLVPIYLWLIYKYDGGIRIRYKSRLRSSLPEMMENM